MTQFDSWRIENVFPLRAHDLIVNTRSCLIRVIQERQQQ